MKSNKEEIEGLEYTPNLTSEFEIADSASKNRRKGSSRRGTADTVVAASSTSGRRGTTGTVVPVPSTSSRRGTALY